VELEVQAGSLGGFFTTVEGLLEKVRDHLVAGNPFGVGDSAIKHHAVPDGADGAGAEGGGDAAGTLQVGLTGAAILAPE
jgi:hypothetical protein